ncbi:hypothetical protein TraAM80_04651 [Trypanosoma rangeli]|uniref:Uncharacterized protein n=1 Tax=Trypanosoma rangeli TaxID=5698 RepID=A0A3S5IR97_TRYRA|nr:uncharacterized protein TraAM80_04651 [Trypanosoma rangeli]RNF05341.1 hypothetical protein TraAM80_04651 [Trypanosoma rangeli]|eukprot:RNF05341.1 hypothetical protein TraAM80_04651 [Trypanosoma rangeli]
MAMRRRRFCTGPFIAHNNCICLSIQPFVVESLARRFQRFAPGWVRLSKESSTNGSHASTSLESSPGLQCGCSVGVFENSSGMPVSDVEEGRRGFLGFGRRAGRTMPLNPLAVLRPQSGKATEDRRTIRFLKAVQMLNGKRRAVMSG